MSARGGRWTPWAVGIFGLGASGALFALFPRVEGPWGGLGWIVFVPWFWALQQCPGFRSAALLALAFTGLFTWLALGWFPEAMADYTGGSLWWSRALLILAAPFLEPQCWAVGLLVWATRQRANQPPRPLLARVALVAGSYVAVEKAWPKLFGDTIGHGLLATPLLVQAADLVGAQGLSFALVAGNLLFVEAVGGSRSRERTARGRRTRALASLLAICATLVLYGTIQWKRWAPQPDDKQVRIGVVQGNLSHYDRLRAELGSFAAVRTILDRYFFLTDTVPAAEVDFWAWPETVYPTTFGRPKSADGAAFDQEIVRFASRWERPVVFGAYDRDEGGEYNAAFFLLPSPGAAELGSVYRKVKPFPLTEWVPPWMEFFGAHQWIPWLGNWKKGEQAGVVEVPTRDGRIVRV